MNKDQFWEIIDTINQSGPYANEDAHLRRAVKELMRYSVKDILDWDHILNTYHRIAYRNDLWTVCAALAASCSDDGFAYFRAWLISRGKEVYMNALHDAKSLFTVPRQGERLNFERFWYVAYDAYGEKLSFDRIKRVDAMYQALQDHPLDDNTTQEIRNELSECLCRPEQVDGIAFPFEPTLLEEPKNIRELLDSLNVVYGYVTERSQSTQYIFYNTPENIANFIGNHLQAKNIIITDVMDRLILSTIGSFIDRCADHILLETIKEILVPIQTGNASPKPFLCPTMEEAEKYQAQQEGNT